MIQQKSFRLALDPSFTTDDLFKKGAYSHYPYPKYMNSVDFPIRPRNVDSILIELLDFGESILDQTAIEEAHKLGLEQPWYEDAFYFGVQYPSVQYEKPIVFFYQGYNVKAFVLCGSPRDRVFGLHECAYRKWGNFYFAFSHFKDI